MRSRSLLWSFNYAIEGIVYTLRTQRNMRLHVAAAVIVLLLAALLKVGVIGIMGIAFAISLVFVTELLNTAIEATVDVAIERYDPLAKTAKDVAAGAVLVAALNALVIGWLVLFEPLTEIAEGGLRLARVAPVGITVIALGLVMLSVLILKAFTGVPRKILSSGGWPSAHSAVAFGAATAIGFLTQRADVLVLGILLAFLVAQSRVEGEIHTIPQVVIGGLLGILVVTVVFQLFYQFI